MQTLKFRYTEDINVCIQSDYSKVTILFQNKNEILLKINYRGDNVYFRDLVFGYDIFSDQTLMPNNVKSTAKDGSAFIAKVYLNGFSYAIRKKKRKSQIVFMKARSFKNYQLGKDVIDAVCFYNGKVSRDEALLRDFFEKRPVKEFNEEEYIKSLDSEDLKDYLEQKRINEIISLIASKNKISSEDADDLAFFVECMPEDSEARIKILSDNPNFDEITSLVLPLIKKAREYSCSTTNQSYKSIKSNDKEYVIDEKYIFSNNDYELKDLNLKEDEFFVYDLMYFFLDNYEDTKDYLTKGIERVKKTIDEVLPYFKKFVDDSRGIA